ncbi:MAG: hypothetical protein M1501_02490, partial [Candidatus Omnitrophica bacterium]|nr:hypothetical protein [Candidatus Omnitrophota bacterium]
FFSEPFGKQKKIGWITGINKEQKSGQYKYKKIIKVYDKYPVFPKRTLKICEWLADTQFVSLGQIFYYLSNNIALNPEYLTKQTENHPAGDVFKNISGENSGEIVEFYDRADKIDFFTEIAMSVQGSQIYVFAYLKDMQKFYERIRDVFPGRVIVLSGEQGKKQKTENWFKIMNLDNIIVVGTRAAIFAPLKSIKLLVVDEPEDFAHKETRVPRYHTRDIAFYVSENENVPLVLSTMQPDLFEVNLIRKEEIKHFIIKKRELPQVILVPLKKPFKKWFLNEFSRHILEKTILENGIAVIINNNIKWNDVLFEILSKDYTDFPVLKIDKNTVFTNKKFRIFIGTQSVMNYLEEILPALVIILNGEIFIQGETFQSEERFFILIQKLRKKLVANARVLIQTYNSQLPVYQSLLKNDFNHFYDYELSIRKKLQFPPFSHIIRLDFPVQTQGDKIAGFCDKIEKHGQVYKENFMTKEKNSILWKVEDIKSSMDILKKTIKEENVHKIKVNVDPLN